MSEFLSDQLTPIAAMGHLALASGRGRAVLHAKSSTARRCNYYFDCGDCEWGSLEVSWLISHLFGDDHRTGAAHVPRLMQ